MTHTLHSITAQSGQSAALTSTTGQRTVALKSDRVIFSPDLALLIVGPHAYRVPVSLFAAVRRALRLHGVGRVGA